MMSNWIRWERFRQSRQAGRVPVENVRPVLGAAAFIAIVAFSGYLAVGFAGVLFSVAFVGGFVLWLVTTHRPPIDPHPVVVPAQHVDLPVVG
jgi:hypothetical protein